MVKLFPLKTAEKVHSLLVLSTDSWLYLELQENNKKSNQSAFLDFEGLGERTYPCDNKSNESAFFLDFEGLGERNYPYDYKNPQV